MTRWARVALTSTVLFLVTLGNPAPLHAANGPSITSLTPNSGAVGASVTIAGAASVRPREISLYFSTQTIRKSSNVGTVQQNRHHRCRPGLDYCDLLETLFTKDPC